MGLLALEAADHGKAASAFFWMLATILVDATDGTLARALRVSERLPKIDGRTLDDVVDYFTYVLVPVYAMVKFHVIADSVLVWAPLVLASGFGFSNVNAKTEDDYFLGFPSYWNLVALYLYSFAWPVWVNSLFVLFLSAMVFAPIRFIYPSKTKPYKLPTLLLGLLWGMQTLALVICPQLLPDWWLPSSLFYPVYYVALSLYLHKTEPHSEGGSAH